MARPSPAWYDAQYNNRARVPEFPEVLRDWSESSERARAEAGVVLDVAYGDDDSERLDIFRTAQPNAPILVYIHGGYWRALDKRDQSFVATPLVAAGALVVVPNYALCPAVSVEHITLQLVRALAWVHRHAAAHGGDASRIVVAGHSAGGHLAALLLNCDWRAVGADLPADLVKGALSISGLFELEPLRHAPFLAPDLKLTPASARRLSPALMPAPKHGRLAAVVGGDESEEFQRQNALIAQAWGARTVTACEAIPGVNHLTVLKEIARPGSRVHALALELLGCEPR